MIQRKIEKDMSVVRWMRINVMTLMLLTAIPVIAIDTWMPLVRSYDKTGSGQIYSTWRISAQGKYTYFANRMGLLEFDGSRWNVYRMNNNSDVRGVMICPKEQRILVGGEGEFGSMNIARNGTLRYQCLSDSLPCEARAAMGNVFDFYEFGGVTYARCDFMVVVMTGGKMRTVKSADKIYASAMWNGTLYVSTDRGLSILSGQQFMPVSGAETLVGKHVNSMLTCGNGIIVCTSADGLFFYDGKSVTPFSTGIRDMLQGDILSCAATNGRHLAVGTVSNGMLVQDMKTGTVRRFSVSTGCYSNMVQSIAFDETGNIWIGHDFGVDYVYLNHPFSILYMDFKRYGMGNTAAIHDDRLYFGTNRNLYCLPWPVRYDDGKIKPVPVGQGKLIGTSWYLYRHHDDLMLMHGKGIYLIEGEGARRVTDIEGTWMCVPVRGRENMLFIGAYQGIYVIRKCTDGRWEKVGRIEGIDEPCRYFEQTADGSIKVYNMNQDSVTTYSLGTSLLTVTGRTRSYGRYRFGYDDETEGALREWNVQNRLCDVDKYNKVISFNRGFMLWDESKMELMKSRVSIRSVSAISSDSVFYSSNFCGYCPEVVIDSRHSGICIEYGVNLSQPYIPTTYQYRLNGSNWSEPTVATQKSYSNLGDGKYTFEVRAIRGGNVQSEASVTFRIMPPWYRTWWAYAALCAVFISVIAFIIMNEQKLSAKKKELTEKNKEVELMKEDIDQLKQEQTEQELRHKSMEMANMAINMTRKNEILISLKDDIRSVAARLQEDTLKECRQSLILINNKIDSNIEDDDILKRFEEQFDLAYNNFISRLQSKHPNLSQKERLLCAYQKMNLSTKEISSLMNISVRGVESLRYRMRKKIGLAADDNLVLYLNNIGITDDVDAH